MLTHAHRRKSIGAWVAMLAVTVVLTTGFDIPINVGSLTEWQPRIHTVGVSRRCNQNDATTARAKAAGAQANNEKARNSLLKLFL